MKKVPTEVKHRGKSLGTVEIPIYDSIDEAKADANASIRVDDSYILQAVNRCIRKDMRDEFYNLQTKRSSPVGQAKALARVNPEFAQELARLTQRYTKQSEEDKE